MKNIMILKTAIFAILIMFGFTGCGPEYVNGLHIPSNSVQQDNSKTKVYYEDVNTKQIRENLQEITKYLNSNPIVPPFWCNLVNENDAQSVEDVKIKCEKNTSNKKVEGIYFKVDEKSNYIISEKVYSTSNRAYTDFANIREFLFDVLKDNPKLRDSFGMSSKIHTSNEIFKKKLIFTTQKEKVREAAADKVKKQIEIGGWQMVNNPKDADKTISFELSRDYTESEVKDGKTNITTFSSSSPNTNGNVIVGNSAMKFANTSNSSSASAGIGMGVALGLSAVDYMLSKANKPVFEYVFPFMKITNTKTQESHVKFFEIGIYLGNESEIRGLTARINNSVNRWPDGTMFNY